MTENKESKSAVTSLKAYQKFGSIGADLFSSVFVGGFLGYWLDILFGTKPAILLVGIFFGALSGFLLIYRMVTKPDE